MQRWLIKAGAPAEAMLLDRGGLPDVRQHGAGGPAVPGARARGLHPGVPPAAGGVTWPAGRVSTRWGCVPAAGCSRPACGIACARVCHDPRGLAPQSVFRRPELNREQALDRLSPRFVLGCAAMSVSLPVERPTSAPVKGDPRAQRFPPAGRDAGNPGLWLALVALGFGAAGHPRAAAGAAAAAGAGHLAGVRARGPGGPGASGRRSCAGRSGWRGSSSPAARPSARRSPPPWGASSTAPAGIEQGFRLVSFSVDPALRHARAAGGLRPPAPGQPAHVEVPHRHRSTRVKQTVVDGLKIAMGDRPEGEQDFASIMHGTHFVLVDQRRPHPRLLRFRRARGGGSGAGRRGHVDQPGRLNVAENQPAPSVPDPCGASASGRYVLLEHLASGGMAEIFLARLRGEGGFAKELVLKVLQERYADNAPGGEDVPGGGPAGGRAAPPQHRRRVRDWRGATACASSPWSTSRAGR